MSNDSGNTQEYIVRIVADLAETLENFRAATTGAESLDAVLEQLRQGFREVEGDAEKASQLLEKLLGQNLRENADNVRLATEIIKAAFKELVNEGRNLEDVAAAFRKFGADLSQFPGAGPALEDAFKAGISGAIRELNSELKETAELEKQAEALAISNVQRAQEWRSGVEQVKQELTSLIAQGVQFRDAAAAIKEQLRESGGLLQTSGGEAIPVSTQQVSEAVREYTNDLKVAEEATRRLFEELRRGGGDAQVAFQTLITNVNAAKTEMSQLVAQGASLREAFLSVSEANKEVGQFSPKELSEAYSQLREEVMQSEQRLKEAAERMRQFSEEAKKGFGDPTQAIIIFRNNVEEIKSQMIALQATSGQSLDSIVQGFRQANEVSKQFSSGQITQAANELKELDTSSRQTTSAMSQLDQVSTVFFGTTLGQLAVNAIQKVVRSLDDLAKRGIEVSRTFFNLSVSVRALQRLGLDITIAEVNEQVSRLSATFSFFTERQIREGVAQILLLTRNLKLSKQEMFDLTEATAALAIITGKDFAEEGLLVARAIASGYTEALQRAGIEASRFRIEQEAMALGIDKAFLSMTQAERAAVTLRLVLDQVGAVQQDVGEFALTMAGQYSEAIADIEQANDRVGTTLTPFLTFLTEAWSRAITAIADVIGILVVKGSQFAGYVFAVWETLYTIQTDFENRSLYSFDFYANRLVERAQQLGRETAEGILFSDANLFKDLTGPDVGSLEDLSDSLSDNDALEDLEDSLEKLRTKLYDILADFDDGVEDAWKDLARRLADIDLDETRKLEDALADFQADLSKIQRDYNDSVAEAQAKYREKEIQAEIDFQERIKQIREKFLFDLEDALRERDAKQVLRLTRQFNLENTQLARENQIAANERERQFQLELQQIAAQRDQRLRERQIEYELQREQISLNAERDRQDANTRFERELEDNRIKYERRKQQFLDSLDENERAMAEHILSMISMSIDGTDQLNAIWANFAAGVLAINAMGETLLKYERILGFLTLPRKQKQLPKQNQSTGTRRGSFAEGGTLVANQPTLAMFGERGPEVATFTPLNRSGANVNKVFGGTLPSRMGAGGSMAIKLYLDEGLRASITNDTINEVAEVFVRELRR